ncbi:uncharacterized protein LOC124366050 [Homalodisca vitripennis]|uniref:uncharacterized protein LOC124366050 n=1 Tax=Homalodisca vitripennis TaxID=197043 RepID=UPI001EE9D53A|nr:uncharacterized protein LOC124366050 [Homalodisca vitripennis]
MVVVDNFSKYTLLFPLRAATAKSVAKHLEEDVFLIYGVPDFVIFDNGSEFIGPPIRNLMQEYKAKTIFTPRHHPQANPTERINRTIGNMLRSYVKENHRHWDAKISQIGCALRTGVNEATGFSPVFLMFGREIALAGEGSGNLHEEDLPRCADVDLHQQRLRRLREVFIEVKSRMRKAFEKNTEKYNLRRREQQFQEGQRVWKRNFALSDAASFKSAKLFPKFVGPFIIKKKLSSGTYTLQTTEGKDIGNWHTADLKPYLD